MADEKSNKKYQSWPIPKQKSYPLPESSQTAQQSEKKPARIDLFYEIEYDGNPVPGVGRYILQPQKITSQPQDEKEALFSKMRDIARQDHSSLDYSRFFSSQVQDNRARIFYRQAVFMKDFTDDFLDQVGFTQYFPFYQMMSNAQLRTYFTWRTRVRQGQVKNTSLSYAFLYIYELINNIGVSDPQDGLARLLSFWQAFREFNATLDKYMPRWLKDYHVYYGLIPVFPDFSSSSEYYPEPARADVQLELLNKASSYKIKRSKYFTETTGKMIADCLVHCTRWLAKKFAGQAADLQEYLFSPVKKAVIWRPFKDALFFDWRQQADTVLVLAEDAVYRCANNKWTYSPLVTGESGRRFIGFFLKQLEASLRKLTGYKYKLTASENMLHEKTIALLQQKGLEIRELIIAAVQDYWQEVNKTVVELDLSSLDKLRQDALITQAALTVPDPLKEKEISPPSKLTEAFFSTRPPVAGGWQELKAALSQIEIKALSANLQGENLKVYADKQKVMLEVLLDSINQKALDHVGANLFDENLALYDDYLENIKDMVD